MGHRVNILLSDEVWEPFNSLPKGKRSQFVNEAIAKLLLSYKRKQLIKKINKVRANTPKVKGDIVEWLRQDRQRIG